MQPKETFTHIQDMYRNIQSSVVHNNENLETIKKLIKEK